jgi:hypothetical protein
VYGLDGLKAGGGIAGARFNNGDVAAKGLLPWACGVELMPCACACSIVMHAPAMATDATRKSIAGAFHSNLLVCMALSLKSDLNAFSSAGSVADPDLTPLPAGGGVNMPILEARAVAGVIAVIVVVIVVIAGNDDEAVAKVVISVVISVVAAAHAGAVKFTAAHAGAVKGAPCAVAEVRVSVSSQVIAAHLIAGESTTAEPTHDASTARSTTNESSTGVSTGESTTAESTTAESTTDASTARSTTDSAADSAATPMSSG